MPDIEAREAFPKILAAYMAKNGMNQADLARRVHVSKQIVSDWLRGKKFPRVDKMQEIANTFGVLMSDMYKPNNQGVKITVKGNRKSFIDAAVKAAVKEPTTMFEYTPKGAMPVIKQLDQQTKSMMKLWEVSTPETRTAVLGVLKAMNKPTKKEGKP